MKIEEKIEIMFESILSELEGLSKVSVTSDPGKIQFSTQALEQQLQGLMEEIRDIRIPIVKPDLALIQQELKALRLSVKPQVKVPSLMPWIITLVTVCLLMSMTLNLYLLWK